jgi:hypothetical protein
MILGAVTARVSRTVLATALAEALLLAGRIQFSGLRQPGGADAGFVRAASGPILAAGSQHASPDRFTWFSPVRHAALKTPSSRSGSYRRQRKPPCRAERSPIAGDKQRTVIPGDLAALRGKGTRAGTRHALITVQAFTTERRLARNRMSPQRRASPRRRNERDAPIPGRPRRTEICG